MKVVINDSFGGFNLSDELCEWLIKEKGWTVTEYNKDGYLVNKIADLVLSGSKFGKNIWKYSLGRWNRGDPLFRSHPHIIEGVKKFKDKAGGRCSSLKVIEIPDDVEWEIEEYDGNEWVAEKHRRWD